MNRFNLADIILLWLLFCFAQSGQLIRAEGSQEDIKEPQIDIKEFSRREEWKLTYPIDMEDDSPLLPRVPVTVKEPGQRLYLVGEDLWVLFKLMDQLDKVYGYSDYGDLEKLTLEDLLSFKPEIVISRYQLSGYLRGGLSARGIQIYHIGPLSSLDHGLYHISNMGIICNDTDTANTLMNHFKQNWSRAGNKNRIWKTYLNFLQKK